jgi:hypothetical protein
MSIFDGGKNHKNFHKLKKKGEILKAVHVHGALWLQGTGFSEADGRLQ